MYGTVSNQLLKFLLKKGFKLMSEVLGLPSPYYSFDRGGWHFIVLNSVINWPQYGTLSAEHFEWLRDDCERRQKMYRCVSCITCQY
jgi:hypothetical protein